MLDSKSVSILIYIVSTFQLFMLHKKKCLCNTTPHLKINAYLNVRDRRHVKRQTSEVLRYFKRHNFSLIYWCIPLSPRPCPMPMSTSEPDTGFWCIESAASPVSWAESRCGYLWKGRGHWEFASDEFSMTSSFSQGFCHYIVVFCYYIGAFGKLHPCVWGKSPFIMDHAIIKDVTKWWRRKRHLL